jgi:hypothetical protein
MAVYRGESALRPAPIHHQPSTLRRDLSCGDRLADLPDAETATFRFQDVTCDFCIDNVTTPALSTPTGAHQ